MTSPYAAHLGSEISSPSNSSSSLGGYRLSFKAPTRYRHPPTLYRYYVQPSAPRTIISPPRLSTIGDLQEGVALDSESEIIYPKFLVATADVREENQIHAFQVGGRGAGASGKLQQGGVQGASEFAAVDGGNSRSGNRNVGSQCTIYSHPHQCWGLSFCKGENDTEYLLSAQRSTTTSSVSLIELPNPSQVAADPDTNLYPIRVKSTVTLPPDLGPIFSIESSMNPTRAYGSTLDGIFSLDIGASDLELQNIPMAQQQCELTTQTGLCVVKPDLHESNGQIGAYAVGKAIIWFDMREKTRDYASLRVSDAHLYGVTDLDFNPNRKHALASGGEDGMAYIWDDRRPDQPLIRLYSHSSPHEVCNIRHNPLHDKLILTSGTDGVVQLWNVDIASYAGTASALLGLAMGGSGVNRGGLSAGGSLEECLESICAYPDHDESVYGITWSHADEFTFGAVSYDGRACINVIPQGLKDEILLS